MYISSWLASQSIRKVISSFESTSNSMYLSPIPFVIILITNYAVKPQQITKLVWELCFVL